MEDVKRMIFVHLHPASWMHRGLKVCNYRDNAGKLHEHVVRLTNKLDVIKHLEVQLVDVATIMSHNFTTTIVDPSDPDIIPRAEDKRAEERAKDDTIMHLKSSCPGNQEAIEFLAKTISNGSTVHSITRAFLNFLHRSNHHGSQAPNESA